MNQSQKEKLGGYVYDLYTTRGGYGKVLKSEIDFVVFHHILMDEVGDPPDYYSIDKKKIYELSSKYKLTETRLKRYLEDDYSIYNEKTINDSHFISTLINIVKSRGITKDSLKEGKLSLNIANPIFRKDLELKLFESKGILDTSFNTEKIVIEVYDFLKLIDSLDENRIKEELYQLVDSKNLLTSESKQFLDEINGRTLQDCLKKIATGFFSKLLGKAGEEAADIGFELISNVINTAVNHFNK